jgi:hypothetical protein
MRNFRLAAFAALIVLFFGGISFAGTVQVGMDFTGVGGQSVGGVYVYPYYFTITGSNGKTTAASLMCDSYSNEINFNETWTADVHGLLSGGGLYGSSPAELQEYEAAAIIFSEVLAGTASAVNGNLAVWDLFFPHEAHNNSGWNSTAQALETNALASTSNYNASFYAHFQVYTPTNASIGSGPQEFLGYNANLPEPASLIIIGSGLVSMFVLMWRKRITP